LFFFTVRVTHCYKNYVYPQIDGHIIYSGSGISFVPLALLVQF